MIYEYGVDALKVISSDDLLDMDACSQARVKDTHRAVGPCGTLYAKDTWVDDWVKIVVPMAAARIRTAAATRECYRVPGQETSGYKL